MQENTDFIYRCKNYNEIISCLSSYNKESILHVLTYCLYLDSKKLPIEKAKGLKIDNISLKTNYRFIDGRFNSITILKDGILKHKHRLVALVYLYKTCLYLDKNNDNNNLFDFITLFNLFDKVGDLFDNLFPSDYAGNELNICLDLLSNYISTCDQQSQIQFNYFQGSNKIARSYLWFDVIPKMLTDKGKILNFDIIQFYFSRYNFDLKHYLDLIVRIYTFIEIKKVNLLTKEVLYTTETNETITIDEITTIYNLLIKEFSNYQEIINKNRLVFSTSSNVIDDTFTFIEPNPLYLHPIIKLNDDNFLIPFSNFLALKAFNGLFFDI
jgi:hypothetical protein